MQFVRFAVALSLLVLSEGADVDGVKKKHHKKHHKHHHNGTGGEANTSVAHALTAAEPAAPAGAAHNSSEGKIMQKMKALEEALAKKEKEVQPPTQGKIEVNGPLPADFAERFIQASARAGGFHPEELQVLNIEPLGAKGNLAEVVFQAPKDIVLALESQAADPNSQLVNSPIRSFLIAEGQDLAGSHMQVSAAHSAQASTAAADQVPSVEDASEALPQTPYKNSGIDVDTAMPYGELEPFGREDTAQELTESSVKESDQMVDQLERAEVAEEKRAVFRALTRLRGAAITSFDGVARSQTGNIDEYNKVHKWRNTHPLHHLADEESDIAKWAFPDNADF